MVCFQNLFQEFSFFLLLVLHVSLSHSWDPPNAQLSLISWLPSQSISLLMVCLVSDLFLVFVGSNTNSDTTSKYINDEPQSFKKNFCRIFHSRQVFNSVTNQLLVYKSLFRKLDVIKPNRHNVINFISKLCGAVCMFPWFQLNLSEVYSNTVDLLLLLKCISEEVPDTKWTQSEELDRIWCEDPNKSNQIWYKSFIWSQSSSRPVEAEVLVQTVLTGGSGCLQVNNGETCVGHRWPQKLKVSQP